mmetsp:Transcript_3056/g.7007  ORF Transcript_3056/g.7007 Transcript_3056/m.7007 type:complete len:351 (-) Transcript_3056:163-1215(-)
MGVYLAGERHVGRQQHGRPVNRVEPEDVLADDVNVARPPPFDGRLERCLLTVSDEGRDVAKKGIKPHVNHLILVLGDRDAPLDGRAGDGEVGDPAVDPPLDLVVPEGWLHKARVLLVKLLQGVLILAQAEKVVLLLPHGRRLAVNLAAVVHAVDRLHLVISQVGLAPHAIVSTVVLFVDVSLVPHALEELLDNRLVLAVGGADEGVVVDGQLPPQLLELGDNPVYKLLGLHPFVAGRCCNFLAVFIRPGDKGCLVALEPLVCSNHVSRHCRVRASHVGGPVCVVERGREHKRLVRGRAHAPARARRRRTAGGKRGEGGNGSAGDGKGVEGSAEERGGGEEGVRDCHGLGH